MKFGDAIWEGSAKWIECEQDTQALRELAVKVFE